MTVRVSRDGTPPLSWEEEAAPTTGLLRPVAGEVVVVLAPAAIAKLLDREYMPVLFSATLQRPVLLLLVGVVAVADREFKDDAVRL